MRKIFGKKENVEYIHRKGAYLVPIDNNKVGVIKTSKGYYFLGGGIETGENCISCIERECLEEAGISVSVKDRVCSAEAYMKHPRYPEIGYLHPIQTYYIGEVIDKISEQTEDDHIFVWIEYEELKGNMFLEMQNWALESCMEFAKKSDEREVII